MRRIALSALAAVTVLGCSVAVLAGTTAHSGAAVTGGDHAASATAAWGYDLFDNPVSCASATSCFAVGEGLNRRAIALPVAESWHAGTWKAVSAARVPGYAAETSELRGVSCKAANYCLAYGEYMGNGTTPYAMTWNGTALTPVAKLPLPSGDEIGYVGAVSCAAVKSCDVFATGPDISASSAGHPVEAVFAWTWNGSRWSMTATPLPGGDYPVINAARCFSATSCVLAGATIPQAGTASAMAPLLANWNGRTLTAMHPAVPAGMNQAEFESISCVAANSCAAAGAAVNGAHTSAFLDVTGGRGWNLTKWSGPSGTTSTLLTGVSCVSRSNCVAAGQITTAKTSLAAALTWNGTKWAVTKVPGPGAGNASSFYGVSCPAAGNCTAIGATGKATAGIGSLLAGHWNGTAWKLTAA